MYVVGDFVRFLQYIFQNFGILDHFHTYFENLKKKPDDDMQIKESLHDIIMVHEIIMRWEY